MADSKDAKQLTVAELIAELLKHPRDALVWHEGCDCYGRASTVTYDASDNSVLIKRPRDL